MIHIRSTLPLFALMSALLAPVAVHAQTAPTGPLLLDPNPAPATLHVTLPDLTGGVISADSVFNAFGCTGHNRSPHVAWTGAPAGTQSFVVVAHDPDAPTGVGFFHWVVFNLPAATHEIALDASQTSLPPGAVQGATDMGTQHYVGPCPPAGETHRYVFTVYALDVPQLPIPATASGAFVRFAVRGHTLALGRATATYHR